MRVNATSVVISGSPANTILKIIYLYHVPNANLLIGINNYRF